MATSALELDFFSLEKESKRPIFERRRSFRDIQGVISKINPEVLKSVIASGTVAANKSNEAQTNFSRLPLCDPKLMLSCGSENNAASAPMTIFYDGKVAAFNVSPDKAQEILKLARVVPKSAESSESNSYETENLLDTLNGDLPLARRKSLQRFLEKRKERLTMVSPYDYSSSGQSASSN